MLSIAPMMDYTDRHFRRFFRLLTRSTVLYTEMVPDAAILLGNREKFLAYDEIEHPVVLQLGGSDPDRLAECARIGEAWGYDAINLNCGCPSERVEQGGFGACLMASPEKTSAIVRSMQAAVAIPITVKHRLGIRGAGSGGREEYSHLREFVDSIAQAGCRHVIVHARIAVLGGLNPAQNRTVPPLDYEAAYRLKQDFPGLTIEVNGGIQDLAQAMTHLPHLDGVMIGRAACDDPWIFHNADLLFTGEPNPAECRKDVMRALLPQAVQAIEEGILPHHVLRHGVNLFRGLPGARGFRRYLSEEVFRLQEPSPAELEDAMEFALSLVQEESLSRTILEDRVS